MQHFRPILTAFAFLIPFAAGTAHALAPDKPALTINENEQLCRPFLNAWAEAFEKEATITGATLAWEQYFDPATLTQLPGKEEHGGFYDREYFFEADIDGDGVKETLHIQGNEYGWRYLGVDLYKVRDKSAFKNLPPDKQEALVKALDDGPPTHENFIKIKSYAPAASVYFIQQPDALYSFATPGGRSAARNAVFELFKIDNSSSSTVCKVELFKPREKYAGFTENSATFAALKNIYGGYGYECLGTMGWTAEPLDYSLVNIFERPHLIPAADKPGWQNTAVATKLRYISWAVTDPASWQTFQALEGSKPSFIAYLADYYTAHFKYDTEKAHATAERAWKYWLDNVIYARNPDGYQLTATAEYIDPQSDLDTKSIVNSAYDAMTAPQISSGFEINRDLLLALIYTRADHDKIAAVFAKLAGMKNAKNEAAIQHLLDNAFLASLGDTALMTMVLDQGAAIDAATNWFKKTPLMYAAQINDHASVAFLIARGASINAVTDGSTDDCGRLERDKRSALMYAAENADEKTIRLLIEKGADIAGKDSVGNDIAWYLNNNKVIAAPAKKALAEKLLP